MSRVIINSYKQRGAVLIMFIGLCVYLILYALMVGIINNYQIITLFMAIVNTEKRSLPKIGGIIPVNFYD